MFDAIPLLEAAARRKHATADDWLRLALLRKPEDLSGGRGERYRAAAFLGAAAVLRRNARREGLRPGTRDPGGAAAVRPGAARRSSSRGTSRTRRAKVLEEYRRRRRNCRSRTPRGPRGTSPCCTRSAARPEDRKRAMELDHERRDPATSPDELRVDGQRADDALAATSKGATASPVLTRAAVALATAYEKGEVAEGPVQPVAAVPGGRQPGSRAGSACRCC